MRVTICDPKAPRHFKPIHEVSNHEPSLVVSTEKVVLGHFERKLIRAQVITQDPNEYLFRNVMIRPSGAHNKCSLVSEDTLTSVGEDGTVFLAVRNRTDNENLTLQNKTVQAFVFRPILVDQTDETSVPSMERGNNINIVDLSDTSTEFSSFAQNILSSTEMLEEGLTENGKRARIDPQLLKPIPGPDLSSDLAFWGEGAKDQLAKVLNEYDDLFMKHKADIGKCTIAKHRIELEPEAIPHRNKANQDVRNLLALGIIQPSYSNYSYRNYSNGDECSLGSAMHQLHSNDSLQEPSENSSKDMEVSSWPTMTT